MSDVDRQEIARTQQQSASLSRELRLPDLILLQVLLIVGLPWTGYAAKLGGAHVGLWLLAIVLFYFPLAATVIFLSRRLPLEGGIYQWAKLGISPFAGFQTAWNYSLFLILIYAASGSVLASNLAYAGIPWMSASSKPFILACSLAFFAVVYVVNVRGLHLARWVTGAGGAVIMGLYLLLAGLLFWRLSLHQAMPQRPFALALPVVSLVTLNLFTKIAFNALSGFEQVAIFAGECHTPERNIARSVWIAGPGIAVLYIMGTGALLAYTPKDKIDLIVPLSQIFSASMGASATAAALSTIAIGALTFAYFTQAVACVAQVSRLPMVAGWDGLLPEWFSELHPKYRTPHRSIGITVAACVVLGAASLIQVGEQEANQILTGAGMACCGIYYLMMFAVVWRGKWGGGETAPWWLRISVLAAGGVTALAVALNVVPVLDVAQPVVFGLKVGGAVAVINAAGAYVYRRSARPMTTGRRASHP